MAKANSSLEMMMRLRVEDLSELKEAFDKHESGVDLRSFVSILLEKLEWNEATVVALVYELIELFHEIAILRHGKMVWDDFTSALIDVGMRASADELAWRDWRYEENSLYTDDLSRQPRHVQYIPELKRIIAFESTRPVIQVFDPSVILAIESGAAEHEPPRTVGGADPTTPNFSLPLLHEVHPLCYQHGYRKDQDQVRSERSPVQVIKYLTSLDILVIAAGDLKLTFWQSNVLFAAESPEPVYIASTEHPQRVLEWAPTASRLFSLATDNAILVWRVVAKKKKSCSAVCTDVLRAHKDMVQDLLLVNDETLVSCGMDSLIKIWDPATLECKSTRRGHKRGVRKLVKHSDMVFVSTGFERDMLGWDVSGLSIAPIFKLSGHTSPILCIEMIPQLGQAISLDDEGYFKWWNMTNLVSMDDNDRCLQTFRFGNDQYPWKPNAFTLFTNGATILASGFHLKWIHRVRLKPKHYASSAVLLNTTTLTLLTTTDRDVHIWDAHKGTLLHVFRGLCRSDITHVVLDARERKFVLSTLGGDVLVFNYLNGALLKSFPRHTSQVSCMVYCKEDEVVLTASWDRSLCLYDDDSTKPRLRCISQAHRADIKCMAYSYHLGLVATGSADGTLKIWDYVYFLLEQAYGEHSVEVNAVAFLDPHPIVLSGYDNGMLVLHSVRPAANPTRLCQFSIDASSPTASVATLKTLYDPFGGDTVAEGITSGRQLVYVGDYSGMLRCWDLYPVLRQHQIAAADESLLPHTSKSYNPRRRIERDGDGTVTTVDRTMSAPIVPTPPVTSAWQAHTMAIKCCTLVESPVACILTCAVDKTTKVWSLDGTLLGILGSATWDLVIDTTDAAAQKWATATALWHDLKAGKVEFASGRRARTLHSHSTLGRVQSVPSLSPPSPLDLGEPEGPPLASLASSNSEKDRLFGQLHGDSTWKKSDIQIARETAWEAEAIKYKARMDRIFKQRPAATTKPDRSDIHTPVGPPILESLVSDHRETLSSLSTTLPRLSSNQLSQMSFDDKDNWSANSLNRQKLIYRHLFSENSRNLRNPTTKKQPKLLLETIDTAPSAFVLQHLGPDMPRKPTPKPRRLNVPTLAASASAPTLSKVVKPRRASSLRLEKMTASAPSLDSIINDHISSNSKATPVAGSPEKTLARFQAMIADRPPGVRATTSPKKSESSPPRQPAGTHVVLPAVTASNNNSSSPPRSVKSNKPPAPGVRELVDADRRILHQPLFGPYPRDHVLEVCRIFVRIDVDNSGVIETSEFVEKLSQLEGDDWRDALNTVFRDLDKDHNGMLDMPELLKAMFPKATNRVQDEMLQFARLAVAAERHEKTKLRELSPKALADITALFHLFDVDNSGAIEPLELLREFKDNERRFYDKHPERSIADRWQLADIVKIFQQYDANANASLELDEFIELFRDSF